MPNQNKKTSLKTTARIPKNLRSVYHNRSQAVDFLRNEGGFFGVKLFVKAADAQKLARDIRRCARVAEEAGLKGIEPGIDIHAHWGKKGKAGYS